MITSQRLSVAVALVSLKKTEPLDILEYLRDGYPSASVVDASCIIGLVRYIMETDVVPTEKTGLQLLK